MIILLASGRLVDLTNRCLDDNDDDFGHDDDRRNSRKAILIFIGMMHSTTDKHADNKLQEQSNA